MPKERINLSVERAAIERGKRYSQMHATSISKLVSDFLSSLPVDEEQTTETLSPRVKRLLGVATGSSGREDYHRYLLEKYGS